MTIKNIFIAAAAIFSLQLAASVEPEKKFDQERYDNLNSAFDEKNNDFLIYNFAPGLIDSDIEIVKAHKEQKEKELAEHKFTLETSWKPALLKLLGGVFGSSALSLGALQTIRLLGAFELIDPSPSLDTFMNIIASPIKYTGTGFITRPIVGPIYRKIWQLYNNKNISIIPAVLASIGLQTGTTLLFGGIAKYLFNKAASYANEIKELEKVIARDEKIIKALESYKEQKEVKE